MTIFRLSSHLNTEHLSELEFSEDDEEDSKVGRSRDPGPVNVSLFTTRSEATSRDAEDGNQRFFQLFR